MVLDLMMLFAVLAVGAYAVDQRNRRIVAEADLRKEIALNATLSRLNENLRDNLEAAQWRLLETDGMGSPGPRSERRVRR